MISLGPQVVRGANALGGLLERRGLRPGRLSASSILNAARRRTGLTDFGDPPPRAALEALTRSLEDDAGLGLIGRLLSRSQLVDLAVDRLRTRATFRRRPELLDQPLERPLFLVGLPRTGTTLLHNLLSLALDARAPRTWELMQPSPPCPPGSREEDRRIQATGRTMRGLEFLAPDLRKIHPIGARDREECYPLLNRTFMSPAFVLHYGASGYGRWLESVTPSSELEAYRAYREQLLLLQADRPIRRWVLKSAVHLYFLQALLEVFPDACIVWTHRDPREQVPSLCSMVAAFRRVIREDLDEHALGPLILEQLMRLGERGAQARARAPERVLDVSYAALVRDPLETVRTIHRHFDLPISSEHQARMAAWVSANPQHKHGAHRYSLSRFGLTEAALRAAGGRPDPAQPGTSEPVLCRMRASF